MGKNKNLSHADIAFQVLIDNLDEGAMHYIDIVEDAISKGYLKTFGKTPERSINRAINQDIKKNIRFRSLNGGYFELDASVLKEEKFSPVANKKVKKVVFTKYKEKKEIKIPSVEKLSKSGSKKRTRTTNTHNSFQNQIATTLESELGFTFKGVVEPQVDLFWSKENFNGIIEVKTLLPENNEKEQLRKAIGQTLQYKYIFEKDTKIQSAVIAVTNDVEDKDWYDICNLANLSLVSPENFLDYFKDLIR